MANRTSRRGSGRRARSPRAVAASTTRLIDALRSACETLDELGVDFALVGGLAVSARAEPRLTRDVDLAISTDDDDAAEKLVRNLRARGYRVIQTVEQARVSRLATVRLQPPGPNGLLVDLLFASCGIEAEIVEGAERLEIIPGLEVPVARAAHLVAMKLLARDDRHRPQDADDLRALLPTLRAADKRLVVRAVALIERRGFARARDLRAAWKELSTSTKTRQRKPQRPPTPMSGGR